MAKFKIEIKKSAVREIKKLPPVYLKRIILKIDELTDNPRSKKCIKLTNEEKYIIRMWRYRILYEIIDKKLTVIVVKIGHSKDVYS